MKKKHPEHVNLERWLVSYADFITLLFAFFVIMYALSQADMKKLKAAAGSLRSAFKVTAGPAGMIDFGVGAGGKTLNQFFTQESPGGRAVNLPAGKTHTAADPDPELQSLKELLEETVSLELGVTELSEKMQLVYDSRGLVVRLAAKDFFAPGRVNVARDLLPLMDRIGRVLRKTNRLFRIEGHADSAEKRFKKYSSTWELSSARAAWVANYWIKKFEIDPIRVGISGYGHYRPLSDGKSVWSRGANRRVEIIVLNNEYER